MLRLYRRLGLVTVRDIGEDGEARYIRTIDKVARQLVETLFQKKKIGSIIGWGARDALSNCGR